MKTRTTVTLEKDLLRRAKVEAAATDRTVSDLVEEGLRKLLGEDSPDLPIFTVEVFKGRPGFAPGISEDDFLSPWELIGRLEREGAADARSHS